MSVCSSGDSRRSSLGSIPVEGMEGEQPSSQDSVDIASIKAVALDHTHWPRLTQASALNKLTLNVYTCSEVLRLHLMSCGGYKATSERQWFRFCSRGGFTDTDDPVVGLRLSNPGLIESLATQSFFDLSPQHKAQLLSCLCHQLLMFNASRDALEEMATLAKQIRKQIRELRYSLAPGKKKNKQKVDPTQVDKQSPTQVDKQSPTQVDKQSPTQVDKQSPTQVDKQSPTQVAAADTPVAMEGESVEVVTRQQIAELECQLYPLTAAVSLQPLGEDRYHNRYWVFPSLPGLYVEHFKLQSLDSHALPPSHPLAGSATPTCTCLSSPPSHDLSLSCESMWSIVTCEDDLTALIAGLNPRGIRESKLKSNLEKMKASLSDSVTQSPFLFPIINNPSLLPFNYTCASDCLELQLREQLLDLEEKLYIGNLGHVRDTSATRKEWREKIENSGAARAYTVTNGEIIQVNGLTTKGEEPVTELANALLQIQTGIEKKYLLSPLGTAVDMKRKGKDPRKNGISPHTVCVQEWQGSLLNTSNVSQVFVHLSTLERSIAWGKSIMNVRCRFCRRKGGDEYMLLCDGCDHGYHTYCLRPPLSVIPEGEWFCNDCCPVTPVKRRRTVSMVSLKEISDSEEEEQSEGAESEEERAESEEEEDLKRCVSTRTRGRQRDETPPTTRQGLRSKVGRHSAPEPLTRNTRKRPRGDDTSTTTTCSSTASPAEMIISAIIDVRCSKRRTAAQSQAEHTLELQLCKALLEELKNHRNSKPFMNPVRRREVS